jgi:hypothetical protein
LPIPFQQIFLCGNGIMPDHPQPDFDFQRDSTFPQVFESSIYVIAAQMIVN